MFSILPQERVQMHDYYKTNVKKITEDLKRLEQEKRDGMEVINCRERQLLARKEMLLWEKNNERVQVRALYFTRCMIL